PGHSRRTNPGADATRLAGSNYHLRSTLCDSRNAGSPLERLIPNPVRLIGVDAQAALAVGFVNLVIAFAPVDATVPLERQNVRGDPVEKPAVVADHDGAAAEVR